MLGDALKSAAKVVNTCQQPFAGTCQSDGCRPEFSAHQSSQLPAFILLLQIPNLSAAEKHRCSRAAGAPLEGSAKGTWQCSTALCHQSPMPDWTFTGWVGLFHEPYLANSLQTANLYLRRILGEVEIPHELHLDISCSIELSLHKMVRLEISREQWVDKVLQLWRGRDKKYTFAELADTCNF